MDRTAWVAVVLSAIGLVAWYAYMARQIPPKANAVSATAAITSVTPSPTAAARSSSSPLTAPTATAGASPIASPAPSVPTFAEVRETLRNADVELHLTNRGGAIAEAV